LENFEGFFDLFGQGRGSWICGGEGIIEYWFHSKNYEKICLSSAFVYILYCNFSQEHVINPKALNLAELYGEFDLSTGEWSDGVISSIMRTTCAGKLHLNLNTLVILMG